MPFRPSRLTLTCAAALLSWSPALAQEAPAAPEPRPAQAGPPASPVPPLDIHVTVVGTTPLPGVELPLDRIPAPVQTSTAEDVERSGALDVSE
ncbi:MAG TPA: hypothetical protein VNN99_16935, partial [Vicinamibacterales bacterium]|nr:hypothetical protein [Vicinamibacterales bacterium]